MWILQTRRVSGTTVLAMARRKVTDSSIDQLRAGRDGSADAQARRRGIGVPFRIQISPHALRGNEREGVRTQFGIIGILLSQEGNEVVHLPEFFRIPVTIKRQVLRAGGLLGQP